MSLGVGFEDSETLSSPAPVCCWWIRYKLVATVSVPYLLACCYAAHHDKCGLTRKENEQVINVGLKYTKAYCVYKELI